MKKKIFLIFRNIFAVLGIISTSILLISIYLNKKDIENAMEIKTDAALLIQSAELQFLLDTTDIYYHQKCYDINDLDQSNLNNDKSSYRGSVLVSENLFDEVTGYIFVKYKNLKAEGYSHLIEVHESDYKATQDCFKSL